jgi:hypothetical protein
LSPGIAYKNCGHTHFERPGYIREYFAIVLLVLVRLPLLKKGQRLDEVRVRFYLYSNQILLRILNQEKKQSDDDLALDQAYEDLEVVL